MIKTDHISNQRIVGGDCFKLLSNRSSNKNLDHYLNLFNFDDLFRRV